MDSEIRQLMDERGVDELTAAMIAGETHERALTVSRQRAGRNGPAGLRQIDPSNLRQLRDVTPLRDRLATFRPASACPPSSRNAEAPPASCPDCNGAGFVSHGARFGAWGEGVSAVVPCHCKTAARAAAAAATQKAQTRTILGRLAAELGRFREATLADFNPERPISADVRWDQVVTKKFDGIYDIDEQRESLRYAADQAHAYLARPAGWLFLCGPYGTGKTLLAAAIANGLASQDRTASYASTPAMLRFIRRGFEDKSADARLEALIAADVLALDDVGTEQLTGWAEALLFDLINARYNADGLTIVTSNLPLERLTGRVGSRIADLAQVVPVIATDYRLERRSEPSDTSWDRREGEGE